MHSITGGGRSRSDGRKESFVRCALRGRGGVCEPM